MSKARLLVRESVRIQKELNSQLDVSNLSRAAIRLAEGRSPVSGVSDHIPNYDETESKLQEIETREVLRQPHRLNPRILEAWINNTISDAEQIELPDELVSSETRQPLIRFGVDRQSLISAGVPSNEVDRIFRALFVYSIGFYQLINKAMEHCAKKNVLVAGIWKVYSILLEYCCYKDYQMVVKTLMLEREQEVARVEEEYRQQLDLLAQNEQHLLTNLEDMREQLNQAQGQLVQETHRREELEDELQQRGSGHEQEVELRLKFESKLNQMFAQQRDLEVRLAQQHALLKSTQSHLEEKHNIIEVSNKKYSTLQVAKQEQDINVGNLERALSQQVLATKTAEQKIAEIEKRTEFLNEMLAKSRENQQNTLADAVSKNLTIERLQSEKITARANISRLENELDGQKEARKFVEHKVSDLEKMLAAQVATVQNLEGELVVSIATAQAKTKELEVVREKLYELTDMYQADREKNIHLAQELDTKLLIIEELQKQLEHVLEGVNEATKGRKIAEERAKILERRQTELIADLEAAEKALVAERHESDRFSTRVKELETDLEFADSKFASTEKQTESQREALLAKIKSLTQIANTEKQTRDMWIAKFEQEQKAHNETVKELLGLRQSTKDLELMTSDFSVKLHQVNLKVDAEVLKSQQLLDMNYSLKSERDELQRALEAQVEFNKLNETNFTRKVTELEIYLADQLHEAEAKILNSRMELGDVESFSLQLWHNLRKEEATVKDLISTLNQTNQDKAYLFKELEATRARDCRGRMRIEEMLKKMGELDEALQEAIKQKVGNDKLLARTQAELNMYKNKIPENLRGLEQPFVTLTNRIKVLEDQLEANAKPPTTDVMLQTHISTREKSMQTLKRSKPDTPNSQRPSSSSQSRKTIVGSEESAKMRVYNLNDEAPPMKKKTKDESKGKNTSDDWKGISVEDRKVGSSDEWKKGPYENTRKSADDRRGSPKKEKGEAQFYRSGGHLLSRGSRLNMMVESGEPTAREGEITPVHLRSMYPQDGSDAFDSHLPELRRPLPTKDMRRYLKQAVSRRQ
mmetsp:Transcript_27503/g.49537  ORF Transcript_27503/g.49537 Transcript_27503/m.49537 type:complete len:1044 (-) Transcript_27503:1687-4818(-)